MFLSRMSSHLDQDGVNLCSDAVGDARRVSDTTCYLKVRSLSEPDSGLLMRSLIEKLLPTRGLIVDLRHGGGVDVNIGLEVGSLFVQSGRVLHFEEQTRRGVLRSSIDLTADKFEWSGERRGEAYPTVTWGRLPFLCEGLELIVLTGGLTNMAVEMLAHVMAANPKAAFWGDATSGDGVPARFFRVLHGKLVRIVRSSRFQAASGANVEVPTCAAGIKPKFELGHDISRNEDLVEVAVRSLDKFFAASPAGAMA